MSIEIRVKEIAKTKGIRMSELAEEVGMTQTNLMKSLRKNPKLSTLEDIASALNVGVADIVDTQRAGIEGLAIIGGKSYTLSKPLPDFVQVPYYGDYTKLRMDITFFIKTAVDGNYERAICGYLEMKELFCLFYDADSKAFNLTLCYGKGNTYANTFTPYEYGKGKDWDKNNLGDLILAVLNDVESVVPSLISANDKTTQEDIDRAAEANQ